MPDVMYLSSKLPVLQSNAESFPEVGPSSQPTANSSLRQAEGAAPSNVSAEQRSERISFAWNSPAQATILSRGKLPGSLGQRQAIRVRRLGILAEVQLS